MTTDTYPAASQTPPFVGETVRIGAHDRSVRKMGHWTTARRLIVCPGGSQELQARDGERRGRSGAAGRGG